MENKIENESTYKLDILCTNCGYDGEIDIERGKQIQDILCPNCGCATLERDYNAHLKKNRRPPVSYR